MHCYCYVPLGSTGLAIVCMCLLLCTIGRYWLHGSLHVCPFCYVLLVHTGRAIVCVRLLFYDLSILAGPLYVCVYGYVPLARTASNTEGDL